MNEEFRTCPVSRLIAFKSIRGKKGDELTRMVKFPNFVKWSGNTKEKTQELPELFSPV